MPAQEKVANQAGQSKARSAPGAPKSRLATLNNRKAALHAYIQSGIQATPTEFNGSLWVSVRQVELAEKLDIPMASLERLVKMPPVVKAAKGRGADKRTLLRLGEPEIEDPHRFIANTMSKIWQQGRGWNVTPSGHYGPLLGLARVLPEGWQIKIFDHTLRCWRDFVTLTRRFIKTEQLIRSNRPLN